MHTPVLKNMAFVTPTHRTTVTFQEDGRAPLNIILTFVPASTIWVLHFAGNVIMEGLRPFSRGSFVGYYTHSRGCFTAGCLGSIFYFPLPTSHMLLTYSSLSNEFILAVLNLSTVALLKEFQAPTTETTVQNLSLTCIFAVHNVAWFQMHLQLRVWTWMFANLLQLWTTYAAGVCCLPSAHFPNFNFYSSLFPKW